MKPPLNSGYHILTTLFSTAIDFDQPTKVSTYILATCSLHSDCIMTTFWLHSYYILTKFWLLFDYILHIGRATRFVVSGFPIVLILGPPFVDSWTHFVDSYRQNGDCNLESKQRPSRLLIQGLSSINNSGYSDYTLAIIWLHIDYIQPLATIWTILATFWLHSGYILTIIWLHIDYI